MTKLGAIVEAMEWNRFDKHTSRGAELPQERQYVLVQCTPNRWGQAPPVAVGYLKFSAGDKDCPYFVVPGVNHTDVIAWSDCLDGNSFNAPLWTAEADGEIRKMWDAVSK